MNRGWHVPLVALLAMAACGGQITDSLTQTGDPDRSQEQQDPDPPATATNGRILIDASHDGGVWWFPQDSSFSPDEFHQGQALADHLRDRGYEVEELPRGAVVTTDLLNAYTHVIRAGEWGTHRAGELEAYTRFVERHTTLVLLSDHRGTDPTDELAEMLGIGLEGVVDGRLTRLADHELTDGVGELPFVVGAAVTAFDPEHVEILGWVDDTIPVMGIVRLRPAKIFFLTDANGVELVPQPFIDNLVAWGF